MKNEALDREVAAVAAQLPAGPCLAVIGSTSFWHVESEATCNALGGSLADLDGLMLLTGGVEGVGEAIGRSFFRAREDGVGHRGVFHILPRGHGRWDYGETLMAGSDMAERREILGRVAQIYVVVEGGPGTAHEASVALARSVLVIPVARSGGCAGDLYPEVTRMPDVDEEAWRVLARTDVSPGQVAQAVRNIVGQKLGQARFDA